MADEERGQYLKKPDLDLLLGAYKNQIELNSVILERQNQLLMQQQQIVDKIKIVCESIEKVVQKVDASSSKAIEVQEKLFEKTTDEVKEVKEKLANFEISTTKAYGNLKYLLYVGFIGLSGIAVSLVNLLWSTYSKFDTIEKVFNIVKEIAKKINI